MGMEVEVRHLNIYLSLSIVLICIHELPVFLNVISKYVFNFTKKRKEMIFYFFWSPGNNTFTVFSWFYKDKLP